jgi:hypothetical protein
VSQPPQSDGNNQPPYGQPPYGQPQYGQPPYGQPPYGQPQYGQPPYGQPQYGQPYGQPQYGQPYGDPYYGSMAPKPGCIPLRPLSVGEILGGTFSAIRRNARVVFTLSAIVAVVQAALSLAVQLSTRSQADLVDQSDPGHPTVQWHRVLTQLGGTLGVAVIGLAIAAALTGMLVVVVTEDVVGRQASFQLVWTKVRSRLFRLTILSLALGLAEGIGLVFCLAPGIWLWGIWAVAVPAMMVENTGIRAAMGRSHALTEGMFWRVWGIRALGYLIAFGISAGIGVVFGVIGLAFGTRLDSGTIHFGSGGGFGESLSVGAVILLGISSAVASMVTAPIKAGVDSLLYVDQRMRKEALAADLQRAAGMSQR